VSRTFDAFDLDAVERLEVERADGAVTSIQVPGHVVRCEFVLARLHGAV